MGVAADAAMFVISSSSALSPFCYTGTRHSAWFSSQCTATRLRRSHTPYWCRVACVAWPRTFHRVATCCAPASIMDTDTRRCPVCELLAPSTSAASSRRMLRSVSTRVRSGTFGQPSRRPPMELKSGGKFLPHRVCSIHHWCAQALTRQHHKHRHRVARCHRWTTPWLWCGC